MSLGPRSYAEIFDWPAKGLESIAAACKCRGRDAMAYLQGLMSCSAEIVLTTHFSGMGTSEMALAMIEDMLQQHGISLPMRVHSATDFNQDCRKVLMSYQPPHGPEHVFGDILDRLPEQAKDRLIARQLYYKQQFEKRLPAMGLRRMAACPSATWPGKSATGSSKRRSTSFSRNAACSVTKPFVTGTSATAPSSRTGWRATSFTWRSQARSALRGPFKLPDLVGWTLQVCLSWSGRSSSRRPSRTPFYMSAHRVSQWTSWRRSWTNSRWRRQPFAQLTLASHRVAGESTARVPTLLRSPAYWTTT